MLRTARRRLVATLALGVILVWSVCVAFVRAVGASWRDAALVVSAAFGIALAVVIVTAVVQLAIMPHVTRWIDEGDR